MKFLKALKRYAASAIAGLVLMFGMLFVISTPAQAVSNCDVNSSAWDTGVAWAELRSCWAYDTSDDVLKQVFQIRDTVTDGYSVHLEFADSLSGIWRHNLDGGTGNGHEYCEASSYTATTCTMLSYFGSTYTPGSAGYQLWVRAVKGSHVTHAAYGPTRVSFFA